jgi:hypothetical protein
MQSPRKYQALYLPRCRCRTPRSIAGRIRLAFSYIAPIIISVDLLISVFLAYLTDSVG